MFWDSDVWLIIVNLDFALYFLFYVMKSKDIITYISFEI